MSPRWVHQTPERQAELQEKSDSAKRRKSNDSRIDWLVQRAGDLSPEQIERLRSLLPDPGGPGHTTDDSQAGHGRSAA